jgi:hypothetical protein
MNVLSTQNGENLKATISDSFDANTQKHDINNYKRA